MKLLVYSPNPTDATSFYRGVGPLSTLSRKNNIDLLFHDASESIDWARLKLCDGLFLQRPHDPDLMDLFAAAKTLNKPVWVDYDDLLTDVPDSNPTRFMFWAQKCQETVQTFIQHADILTVSTKGLASCYEHLNPKAIVIPNAWDDDLFPKPKTPGLNSRSKVFWRGGATHDEDWFVHMHAVQRMAELNLDWYLMGEPFWLAVRNLQPGKNRVHMERWTDLIRYFKYLEQTSPGMTIVPLKDSLFNRAKSNIAWIESAWAGACTIAPNWGEWQRPGVIPYETPDQFAEAVKAVYNKDIDNRQLAKIAWEYIESELRLSKINQERLKILNSMV